MTICPRVFWVIDVLNSLPAPKNAGCGQFPAFFSTQKPFSLLLEFPTVRYRPPATDGLPETKVKGTLPQQF